MWAGHPSLQQSTASFIGEYSLFLSVLLDIRMFPSLSSLTSEFLVRLYNIQTRSVTVLTSLGSQTLINTVALASVFATNICITKQIIYIETNPLDDLPR